MAAIFRISNLAVFLCKFRIKLSFKPQLSSEVKNVFSYWVTIRQRNIYHRLKALKQDYNRNSREIHATEHQLNGLISTELRAEILQNKKFEVLNDEKMTAHFVSLMKIKGEEVTISEICDDNGSEFLNVNERSSYIKSFYGSYAKNQTKIFWMITVFPTFWVTWPKIRL
jgi:hypothetical protein